MVRNFACMEHKKHIIQQWNFQIINLINSCRWRNISKNYIKCNLNLTRLTYIEPQYFQAGYLESVMLRLSLGFRKQGKITANVRMAEWSKAPDSSSGLRERAWVQIPLLTLHLILVFVSGREFKSHFRHFI